jgi:hypothetical protein
VTEFDLTQSEADLLIQTAKVPASEQTYTYPCAGGSVCVPLVSEDHRENFLLDVSRGRIDLLKGKYQTRAKQVVVLVRLDFGDSVRHTNPDGETFEGPHLHLYRQGFGDKFAVPVPLDRFSNLADAWLTLEDFFRFCNVVRNPGITRGLFT